MVLAAPCRVIASFLLIAKSDNRQSKSLLIFPVDAVALCQSNWVTRGLGILVGLPPHALQFRSSFRMLSHFNRPPMYKAGIIH
jgi:hypothetical protein